MPPIPPFTGTISTTIELHVHKVSIIVHSEDPLFEKKQFTPESLGLVQMSLGHFMSSGRTREIPCQILERKYRLVR